MKLIELLKRNHTHEWQVLLDGDEWECKICKITTEELAQQGWVGMKGW